MSEEKLLENVAPAEQQQAADEKELDLMELEIFRNAWAEINNALSEIRALRGGDTPEQDPVQIMKSEVATLKKNFAELKDLILKSKISAEQQASQVIQQSQYQPPRQMQAAVPLMPYYQTPSFAPIIQMPQ